MKNLFSSPFADLQKFIQINLTEQQRQRADLADIKRLINRLINDLALQKQVDDYMDQDETSPQTDVGEQ